MSEFDAPRDVFALTDAERIEMLQATIQTLRNDISVLDADIRVARSEITDMDDPRLNHLWEKAAEIADAKGYCDVFDTILEELGTSYARTVEICVTVEQTLSYDIHVTIPKNDMYESTVRRAIEEEIGNSNDLSAYDEIHTGDWQITDWTTAE